MDRHFNFPVYGTQGGGLVREVGEKYIFITKPNCPGFDIGDEMPEEWNLAAANELALRETAEDRFNFEIGLNEFYDALIEARQSGNITHKDALGFFLKRSAAEINPRPYKSQ